jgi:hypothetical protein
MKLASCSINTTSLNWNKKIPAYIDFIMTDINASIDKNQSLTASGKTVYKYVNSAVVIVNSNQYLWILANHPEWFLADSASNKIVEKSYSSNYLLDIGNPDVREWRLNRIRDYYLWGSNGIWFDVMAAYLYTGYYASVDDLTTSEMGINPRTGLTVTSDEWYTWNLAYLQEAQVALGNVCPNLIGCYSGDQYFRQSALKARDFIPYASYMHCEGVLLVGGSSSALTFKSPTASGESWEKDVNMLIDIGDKTLFQVVTIGGLTTAEWYQILDYHFNSYLMGTTTNSHLWIGYGATMVGLDYNKYAYDAFNNLVAPSETFTAVSAAKGRLSGGTNTYHRTFEGGMALVNPSTATDATVLLGGTYYDSEGVAVTSVAMGPDTGKLLLTNRVVLR